jgi:hypothetical protein
MKGKHGALARNRLVRLDNELLVEVMAERDVLRTELDLALLRNEEQCRDANAVAMRKAGVMAAEDIAAAQARALNAEDRLADFPNEISEVMATFIHATKCSDEEKGLLFARICEYLGTTATNVPVSWEIAGAVRAPRAARRISEAKIRTILAQPRHLNVSHG